MFHPRIDPILQLAIFLINWTRLRFNRWLISALFVGSLIAVGEELNPKRTSWSIREGATLDVGNNWDNEYSSDRLTYSLPLDWQTSWQKMDNAYRMSLGSLSSKRFANYQQIKLKSALSATTDFHFEFIDQGDFDVEYQAYFIELAWRLNDNLSVSLFGHPSTRKAEDDLGVELTYRHSDHLILQVFYQAV